MRLLFNALAAFTAAAWFTGAGPFAGPADRHWQAVAADLAAAKPHARLTKQFHNLFQSGTPRPEQP